MPKPDVSVEVIPANWTPVSRIGLFAGPVLAIGVMWWLQVWATGLEAPGRATAAVGILMAVWWMTEAIPLEATSLLPLVLFPLLGALPSIKEAAAPYADEPIFLYLGGFLLALAVERWGLHRRLALWTLLAVGTSPRMLVAGFMLATAFISMWISNTATTLMMLPIGLSVIHLLTDRMERSGGDHDCRRESANLAMLILLGIAYAASIGGMGTLIGTPPNVFFKGFLEARGIHIGFGRWMLVAVPICGVYLLLAWWVMTIWLFPIRAVEIPGGRELIRREWLELGRMSPGEWIVLGIFAATAALWVAREWLVNWTWLTAQIPAVSSLTDALIAMAAAILLFVIPVDWRRGQFALDWKTASRVPWGILLLFGGGLSLAKAMTASRLDQWIGTQLEGLASLPTALLLVVLVVGVILLSELASNLATAITALPILYALAVKLDLDPLSLCVPAVLAASCGFMLPVATPPNTIVFGTGYIPMPQMMRAGLWLDAIGTVLIPLASWTIVRVILEPP